MKKYLIMAVMAMAFSTSWAQSGSGWGIKGGLNFASNGDFINDAGDAIKNPSRNTGFHIGVFGKYGRNLYLRPELLYTKTKSDYDGDKFDVNKLDLPVLVGIEILGPLFIQAGPAFQYIMNSKFDGAKAEDIDKRFSVGLNIGGGVNLGNIGLELRYERGFTENEIGFISDNVLDNADQFVDARPDQIILSASLKF